MRKDFKTYTCVLKDVLKSIKSHANLFHWLQCTTDFKFKNSIVNFFSLTSDDGVTGHSTKTVPSDITWKIFFLTLLLFF